MSTASERYTAIEGTWLVEVVNEHTCGTSEGGYYGLHEPGCGTIPLENLENLPGWESLVAHIKGQGKGDAK